MGETIWLGDVMIWAGLALTAFSLSVWYFIAEAEHEDFIGLFWRWLLLLTAVAGFSAAVFLGFLPSEAILPVLFLSFAALLGGLLGIVIGLFRSR
ncbi:MULTISPECIES: hypothetical protein [Roseovarius]|jgi:hypothetical protein|uniref:Uncharacterized protein n=1 Tax=Roseovarius nubinhibens (strain ATCC BAA-591 / DSM 15170 / ISM) TaxID=89187 RepID=A3SHB3_ROSNI|nr:hypothetical protein [Roseovarius nubinhibens]EAP76744.1 hypothetical protein ISM_00605 [Roseovarius nubinhibens ISM]